MKNMFRISGFMLCLFVLLSCKEKPTPPTLSTTAVSEISYTSAISGGNVTDDGGETIISRGICWNTSADPTISDNKTINDGGLGDFTANLIQLIPNSKYYVRAYATNSAGTGYGNQISFTTLEAEIPILTTSEITSITSTTAVSGGNITDERGVTVNTRGVCWSTSANPTINDNSTSDGKGIGIFTSTIAGLQPVTKYYVRAYATNSAGTAYGNELNLTTLSTVPTLSTTVVTDITVSTAKSGGNITGSGGADVTARGVCWSTSANPTINDNKTSDGKGLGVFSSSISGLQPGTKYFVRSYATNSAGTAYGNELNLTTLITVPTLSTTVVTDITISTAKSGGNITNSGGGDITARGVCWSTSANPTINDNKTSDGIGMGVFTSTIAGLQPGTKYFVRAYATNSAGTAYGNELNLTTLISVPILSTTAVTDITVSTAKSGGNITGSGGADVTARGVCWSTSQTPTVDGNISTDGSGTGNFTSNLTKLIAGTTYYTRAYATNSAGTAYGNVQSFETKNVLLYSTTCTSGGSSVPNTLMQIDPKNGTGKILGSTGPAKEQFSLDMDPITGSLFGVNNAFPGVITKIDVITGSSSTASTIHQSGTPVELWGITFNPEGILYGITGNHTLGIIDLNKGTFTPINKITTENCIISGIDFSPGGKLYAIKNFSEPFQHLLITIDEKTGTVKSSNILTSTYSIGDIDFSCDGYIYGTNYSWALMKINPIEFTITFIGFNSFGALGGIASSLK